MAAFNVPTGQQVIDYLRDDVPDSLTPETAATRGQAALDLLTLATGATEYPRTGNPAYDQAVARTVDLGVLDMAAYLVLNDEEISERYSPYTSERIGSYSYSKKLKDASLTGTTGVVFYDAAVAALLKDPTAGATGSLSIGGEQVFQHGVPFSAWGAMAPSFPGYPPPPYGI